MGSGALGTLVAAQKALRKHAMPFGAEVLDSGVRFRLWAPGAQKVELSIDRSYFPMQKSGDWFELVHAARPGALYRYRIDGRHDVPDPASRFQPRDVDGSSEVIDPHAFEWRDEGWREPVGHRASVIPRPLVIGPWAFPW